MRALQGPESGGQGPPEAFLANQDFLRLMEGVPHLQPFGCRCVS